MDLHRRPAPPTESLPSPPRLPGTGRAPVRADAAGPPFFRLLAGLVALATMVLLAYGTYRGRPMLPGLVAIPILLGLAFPLLVRWARDERAFDLAGIAFLGLALRFFGSYFRFQIAADANQYYNTGLALAKEFRSLNFAADTGREIPGTGAVRWFSGLVLTITGPNIYLEFVVFTVIAFAGMLLMYKAFVIGFPTGDRKRYALLVLLWPSMVFWPSSIGKEALMTFGAGLASYGAARMFAHRPGGILSTAGGLAVLLLIRPHVAMVVLSAIGTAYLFVRSTSGSLWLSGSKILAIGVLLIGGSYIATQTAEFLNLENLGTEGVNQAFQFTEEQTSQGGAEFTPVRADSSPAAFPLAVGTVLFRPFPFEAHNLESVLASIEGLMLLTLTAVSFRRLIRLPGMVLREPYVAYAVSTVLLFCFVFSVIGNFGILSRQRTQLLPLYFVILAIPLARAALASPSAPTGPEPRRRRPNLLDAASG